MIRRYVGILILTLVAFALLAFGLPQLSKSALENIQASRQETARINALMAVSLSKEPILEKIEAGNTSLRELLTSQNRLPSQLATIAKSHEIEITNTVFPPEATPSIAASGLAQVSLLAPNQKAISNFLKQLESGTPFLQINEANIAPQTDGRYQARITLRFFTP